MAYPRVVIFGQAFNKTGGGGITLSNLFSGWDKDKIAVICLGHCMQNLNLDLCNTYYQIGEEERKWIFPFNLVQHQFRSGVVKIEKMQDECDIQGKKNFRKKIVNTFFYPVLRYFGLFHSMSRMVPSQRLLDWLSIFKPEIIYVQISAREEISFVNLLHSYLKIPLITHMMDDWPSVISSVGILKNYWQRKINSELWQLIQSTDLLMTISDEMTRVYENRYNRSSITFHNPVDINIWKSFQKTNYEIHGIPTILYAGRIGTANTRTILYFTRLIDTINSHGIRIKFDIITPDIDIKRRKLKNLRGVQIKTAVPYSIMPSLMSDYDILFLSIDFDRIGFKFAQLSMPTKVPEYMISGIPVLVFADERTAIARHAIKYKWAYVVTQYSDQALLGALDELILKEQLRKEIGSRAKEFAAQKENSEMVRKNFRNCFYFNKPLHCQ